MGRHVVSLCSALSTRLLLVAPFHSFVLPPRLIAISANVSPISPLYEMAFFAFVPVDSRSVLNEGNASFPGNACKGHASLSRPSETARRLSGVRCLAASPSVSLLALPCRVRRVVLCCVVQHSVCVYRVSTFVEGRLRGKTNFEMLL